MKNTVLLIVSLLALFLFAAPVNAETAPADLEQTHQQPQPPTTPATVAPAAQAPTPATAPAQPAAPVPAAPAAPAVHTPAAPAVHTPAAPAPASATPPASEAGAATDDTNLLPENLGAGALDLLMDAVDALGKQVMAFANAFISLPQVCDWFNRQASDTNLHQRWSAAGNDLIVAVGSGLGAAAVLQLLLLPMTRHLRRREPVGYVRRVLTGLGVFALKLLPVILFIGLSLTLLDRTETMKLPRFIVLNTIYALSLSRLVMLVARLVLSPGTPALQLIPQDPAQAKYFYRWVYAFGFVTVFGYFLIDVARAIRMPAPALSVSSTLLGLLMVAMTVTIILQKRSVVAVLLRGNLSAAHYYNHTLTQSIRLWLARNWHSMAVAYIIIGYLVTLIGPEGSFGHLLRGTALTILAIIAASFASRAVSRLDINDNAEEKKEIDRPLKRIFLHLLIWLTAALCIIASWGADIMGFLATPIGHRISSVLISIGITIAILAFVYTSISAWIERRLNQQDQEGNRIQASARMRTLLPMLRNMTFLILATIAALVVMAQLGVNIGPLLAGAGALGVAIGLGAQALIKDFLTGISIVLDNVIAIGDVVKIGDHSGTVEAISMRALRLRDGDGSVHILPFSEVSKIINMTRDFAYAPIKVGVAYNTDLRKAMEVIRAVGEEMKKDAKLGANILEPVEVLGVDKFGDSAITLMAQIRTRPGKQWSIKREFLLRLKERFDTEGIQMPSLPPGMTKA